MNTYIQDKLDELLPIQIDILYNEDGQEIVKRQAIVNLFTDYHNHIVEKIENQKEIFGMSDFQNETQFNRKQKHNDIIYKVLSSLQDTNQKE